MSETVELSMTLTAVREAVRVEGEQEAGRGSPPAVPRTRLSTSDHREREGPGRRREEGVHFLSPPYYSRWGWRCKYGRGLGRVLVVSTSLISSSSSPTIHCARCGPTSADLNVRGCPFLSRLRSGAAKSGRAWEAPEGGDGGAGHGGGEGGEVPDQQRKSSGGR